MKISKKMAGLAAFGFMVSGLQAGVKDKAAFWSPIIQDSSSMPIVGANTKGAESAPGGNYKTVHVTTLKDSFTKPEQGSLRWALEKETGPRKIVFDVEGVISAYNNFKLADNYVTVDGATAPGKGITIRYAGFGIDKCHDVIVRHLRIRPSDHVVLRKARWAKETWAKGPKGGEIGYGPADAFNLKFSENVLVENISVSWSLDEAMSARDVRYVTFKNCLVAEPLGDPNLHSDKTVHAYNSLIVGKNVVIHDCLFAFGKRRNPRLGIHGSGEKGNLALVNNVIYGFGDLATQLIGITKTKNVDQGNNFQVINNYYKPNNNKYQKKQSKKSLWDFEAIGKNAKFYISGNESLWTPGGKNQYKYATTNKTRDPASSKFANQLLTAELFKLPASVPVKSAKSAYDSVLKNVGAMPRDCIDKRIVDSVKKGKGGIIKSQDDSGGFKCLGVKD